ncbi:hypothetical protein [Geodermatophilus sp. DSM 44513]|uniref:hypothetical protein n=1 Tax=Geodermatophilus sp. DSM 44513 TaxID=1528104 RepID=UPI0014121636|nr:hypothetical protein [Geodermatophilus sp. DSM 44513]WNV74296.1 hypothetical protein RTG05_15010 [Geodermatophilus sp. DSM 44513]
MPPSADDLPGAVARGGPLDGSMLGEATVEEFEVLMADGSRHLYTRTQEWSLAAPGVRLRLYAWSGRQGS